MEEDKFSIMLDIEKSYWWKEMFLE